MRRQLVRTGTRWLPLALALACVLPSGPRAAAAAEKAKPKPAAAAPAANEEKIATELKAFCRKWMGFLETRERDNTRGIKWQAKGTGMAGQYVGYSKEYDCVMKERSSNGTPVATIVYKEFVYEKAGASKPEAEQAQPSIVDATEVTEIFRYTKGAWVY